MKQKKKNNKNRRTVPKTGKIRLSDLTTRKDPRGGTMRVDTHWMPPVGR